MNLPLNALAALALVLTGCEASRDSTGSDPLGNVQDSDAVGRILTCEAKDAAGNCIKKSCKKDENSDCRTYAGYCLDHNHKWSGTRNEGTCEKVT